MNLRGPRCGERADSRLCSNHLRNLGFTAAFDGQQILLVEVSDEGSTHLLLLVGIELFFQLGVLGFQEHVLLVDLLLLQILGLVWAIAGRMTDLTTNTTLNDVSGMS